MWKHDHCWLEFDKIREECPRENTQCDHMYARQHNKFDWDRRAGKTARQVVGAFRIPQEFPESLPQWVITRIRPRLSPLVAPSLTWLSRVPTRGWLTLGSPPACVRERDDPLLSRCLSHSRTAPLRHVRHPHTLSLIFSRFPTDAHRLPRKRSQLGYSEPRDGARYSEESYRVRIVCVYVGTCVTSTPTGICHIQRVLVACTSRELGLTDIGLVFKSTESGTNFRVSEALNKTTFKISITIYLNLSMNN